MSARRVEVVLPAVICLVFGAACGLIVGYLIGTGGQAQQSQARRSAPQQPAPQAAAQSDAQRAAEVREALTLHEELVAEDPDNARLWRTIGEYRSMLGNHGGAREAYERAVALARSDSEQSAELMPALMGKSVVLVETNDLTGGLALLEQAAELDPRDPRPLMVQAYIYLFRIMSMPTPPEGFDRRSAARRAEELVDQVLALDPTSSDARRWKDMIMSIRQQAAPPAAGQPAP